MYNQKLHLAGSLEYSLDPAVAAGSPHREVQIIGDRCAERVLYKSIDLNIVFRSSTERVSVA